MSTQSTQTDQQLVEELLRHLDIEFHVDRPLIRLREGMKNVGGYSGFEVIFEFDKTGKFLEVGAYT